MLLEQVRSRDGARWGTGRGANGGVAGDVPHASGVGQAAATGVGERSCPGLVRRSYRSNHYVGLVGIGWFLLRQSSGPRCVEARARVGALGRPI